MKKALFLDRDGVINIEKNYLYKIKDFEFINGIFDLCRYYQNKSFIIIVVTNQSGIARDFYSKNDFNILTNWMIDKFKFEGIIIKDVFYCPHHPDYSKDCDYRKPKPGMLFEAQKKYNIDLKNSILVGDKERDIEAGIDAGLCETYLFDEYHKVTQSKATKIVNKLEDIYNVDFK